MATEGGSGQPDPVRLIAIVVGPDEDRDLLADRCWGAGAAGIVEGEVTWQVGVEDHDAPALCDALADHDPVDVSDAMFVPGVRDVIVDTPWGAISLAVPDTVFGDGTHPTTALCLELLAAATPDGSLEDTTVLEVGCGSGVLALAAALGGATVTAIDIDPDAVRATADSAAANGLELVATTTALDDVDGPFDLVVCNMTLGDQRGLHEALVRATAIGGSLLVSGLLVEQVDEVVAALGRTPDAQRTRDGWAAIRVRRRS